MLCCSALITGLHGQVNYERKKERKKDVLDLFHN